MTKIFDIAVCTIFAREILEAAIIIGQYRTVLLRSSEWQEPEKLKRGLRGINTSAAAAAGVALVMILAISVPLILLSRSLSPTVIQIVEGVSKLVASVAILQLSLKIPRLLGIYPSKKKCAESFDATITLKEIQINIAWNVWREVAEVGVFILPFFLAGEAIVIPFSAVIGILIGAAAGIGIYIANNKQKNMVGLSIVMASLTGLLATGLFSGGCHLMETALGPTKTVWVIDNEFWDHNRLPMTIFKPFGYSASRTVLQIVAFWTFAALTLCLHYWKYRQAKTIRSHECREEHNHDIETNDEAELIDKEHNHDIETNDEAELIDNFDTEEISTADESS